MSTSNTVIPPLARPKQSQQSQAQNQSQPAQSQPAQSQPTQSHPQSQSPQAARRSDAVELESTWITAARELNQAKRALELLDQQRKSAMERVADAQSACAAARGEYEDWVLSHT